jgi:Tfp pilus assembly protein FimV
LQGLYCPMRLTSHEEANLIGQNDKVDTIGVPTALLAIDAAPDSPRAERLAPVAEHLFAQFDSSLGALPVSKWKDVNLAARILGWPRLAAAQTWLDQNKGASNVALDTFRSVAETAASAGVPGGADSDRLYDSLIKLSGAAQ